jgi:hypothetical protein
VSRPETPTSIDLMRPTPVELPRPPLGEPRSAPTRKPTVAPAADGTLVIPGFELVECISQHNPLALWKVRGADRRHHVARLLPPHVCQEAEIVRQFLERTRQAQHDCLPNFEVVPCSSGAALVARDCEGKTLLATYQNCVAAGLPGIPRDELLTHLGQVADALDTLRQEGGLWHLGLNPLSILIEDDGVWLTDLALVHQLWLPAGLPLARCHQRYAAPELLAGAPGDRSDQYSLALIFAEMINGFYPRQRVIPGPQRYQSRLDLTLLSSADQAVIRKALADRPEDRFASCADFIDALRGAAQPGRKTAGPAARRPPAVVPIAVLRGEQPPALSIPSAQHLLHLVHEQQGYQILDGFAHGTYWLPAENTMECNLPLKQTGKTLRLKLQAFCEGFGTTLDRRGDTLFSIRVAAAEGSRGFLGRLVQRESGMQIQIEVYPPVGEPALSEAVIHIAPFGTARNEQPDRVRVLALELLKRLQACLDVAADYRAHVRLPFTRAAHIYPLGPGMRIGTPAEGRGRNLSLSGAGLELAQRPPTPQVYVHFPDVPALRTFALLARVVHVNCREDQTFEVGLSFLAAADSAPATVDPIA